MLTLRVSDSRKPVPAPRSGSPLADTSADTLSIDTGISIGSEAPDSITASSLDSGANSLELASLDLEASLSDR